MYLSEFLKIGIISLLGAMSPGPDFIMIARNSLVVSRRAAIFAALGLATGVIIHFAYVIAGVGVLISQTPALLRAVQYIGAAYLVYLGIQSLRAPQSSSFVPVLEKACSSSRLTAFAAWRMGLTTNLTNPKCTLFILSVFTQAIDRTTPLFIQLLLGIEMAIITLAWFTCVTLCLTHKAVGKRAQQIPAKIDRVFGAILLSLGIFLFF